MPKSILKIRDVEYVLEDVELSESVTYVDKEDDESSFTIDLYGGDCDQPGFGLNNLTIAGIKDFEELQSTTFHLDPESDDSSNELGESVFSEKGATLEIEKLTLRFGKIKDDVMDIELEATCLKFDPEETDISVSGHLHALIKRNT